MKSRCIYFAAVCLALAVLPRASQAQQNSVSATWNMPGCRQYVVQPTTMQSGFCAGAVAMALTTSRYLPRGGLRSCPPEEVSVDQGVRVVVAYIDRIPARHHEIFYLLLLEALKVAWPCADEGRGS